MTGLRVSRAIDQFRYRIVALKINRLGVYLGRQAGVVCMRRAEAMEFTGDSVRSHLTSGEGNAIGHTAIIRFVI